jgi:SAM-dependent methyltransferase
MSDVSSLFDSASFDCAINVFTSIGYGKDQDDLHFFRELRKVIRVGGLFVISGLRNRDFIVTRPAANVYEESDRLLVLDKYRFDLIESRERGSWTFYLKMGKALKWAGELPVDIRLYSPHELVAMLASSGWRLSGVYESLATMAPFRPESPFYAAVVEAV